MVGCRASLPSCVVSLGRASSSQICLLATTAPPDPAEFLQLYELSIEVANSNEKVMANWFPMALKDGPRSWLLNLPPGSISSWDEMRNRFIANF